MQVTSEDDDIVIYDVGFPLHDEQIEILRSEYEELARKISSGKYQLFFKYFSYLIGYDSTHIKFVFTDTLETLPKNKKNKLFRATIEIFENTEFLTYLNLIKMVEEDLEELEAEDYFKRYLDACIYCGYTLSLKDVEALFRDYMSKQEVAKKSLLHRINHPGFWIA